MAPYFNDIDNYQNINLNSPDFNISVKENRHSFTKNDDAFNSRSGICYTDDKGSTYTYHDLFRLCQDENGVGKLYQELGGSTPEDTLDSSWNFRQCKRCGTWGYCESGMFSRRQNVYCHFCTPLRTNGKIKLEKDPYDDDRKFYAKRYAVFQPGVTTLVGCNGIGKTTLLSNIKNELQLRGTPYVYFDNLAGDGGEKSFGALLDQALSGRQIEGIDDKIDGMGYAVTLRFSSEGERIKAALLRFVSMARKQLREYTAYGEVWLLFDALDSGLSVDVISQIKDLVFRTLVKTAPEHMRVYIIVSSNSYEMSEGTMMFSVEKMKYISARTYSAFKKAVVSSAVYKEKRDDVFRVKAEIWERKYSYLFSDELEEQRGDRSVLADGMLAEMVLCDYKMELWVHQSSRAAENNRYCLYRKNRNNWEKIPCRGIAPDISFHADKRRIEEQMHDYLCGLIFRREKSEKNNSDVVV